MRSVLSRGIYLSVLVVGFVFFSGDALAMEKDVVFSKVPHALGKNCVLWARSMEPRLPLGLWTQRQKNALINSQEPQLGAIAITEESYFGHVAIVTGTTMTHTLVKEANYIAGYVTTRAVPKEKIKGYVVYDRLQK